MTWPPARGRLSRMKWLRSNVKTGSRLALFALALQFALSFGHFHAAAQAAPAIQSGLSYALTTADEPASNPDSDQRPNDPCAICAVIALANSVLFAPPPPLLLPQAIAFLYLATDAEFVHLSAAYPAFQSRAPPIS